MTRADYIEKFIAKHGPNLAMNIKGEHVYLVPIRRMAEIGMRRIFGEIEQGRFKEVTGTPEAEQNVSDEEVVSLMSIIQGAPPAPAGVYKLPDDPLGITRVSLGGDTQEAVYVAYRGNIETAVRLMEISLHLMKEQAKKGEAPPPHNPAQN